MCASRPAVKNILTKILVILGTIFACTLLLEAGLRIIGRLPSNLTDGYFEQHGNSYRMKKNMEKVTSWPSFTFTTKTNEHGYRDRKTGTKPIGRRNYYVFSGASETFANGVDFEDSFVGLFEDEAIRHGIDVVNLGTGGHRFPDQEELFKELLTKSSRKPGKVFVCLTPVNLPVFNLPYNNILVKSGYLFKRDSRVLPHIKVMAANVSSAYCFFRDNFRKLQAKLFKFNVAREALESFKMFKKTDRMFRKENVEEFTSSMDEFNGLCRKNNIELVFLYLPMIDGFNLDAIVRSYGDDPADYDASYYKALMKDYCASRGIRLINPEPALKDAYDKGVQLRFKFDPHYNKQANKIVADYLVKSVITQ